MMERTPVQVLIVDADEVFRRKISERLHLEGAEVFEACDEVDARAALPQLNSGVVLLGANGIRRRGFPLLRFLKENAPSTEVIVMTPLKEHSLALSLEAMKLGAFDEILMPFDVETLLDRIRAASRKKKKGQTKHTLQRRDAPHRLTRETAAESAETALRRGARSVEFP